VTTSKQDASGNYPPPRRSLLPRPKVPTLARAARVLRRLEWHADVMPELGRVTVLVPDSLRPLLYSRHRVGVLSVADDGVSTIGHVVGSLGLPLTEVGDLRADGSPVTPSWRPTPGSVVTVMERARPQATPTDPPRFILDVHLGTLARRMRLLGIDTVWRNDASDQQLIAEAVAEQRVILTRDRGLLLQRSARDGAYVRGQHVDEQLCDVLDRFRPSLHPWTRCPECNGVLQPVAKSAVVERLQPGTRRTYDAFSRCSSCDRVYWEGAHHARLQQIVERALSVSRRSVDGMKEQR
jgi:uncharacterized protein with PIN domain